MRQKGSGHPCAPGRDPFRGRARFLKHLLKANHVRSKLHTYDSLVSSRLRYGNRNAQILSTPNQLHDIRVQGLGVDCRSWKHGRHRQPSWWTATGRTSWETSRTADQRAYLDYFVDKLAIDYAYGWKEAVGHYLFSCEKPLVHGLIISEFGHALIQLGLAYEVESKDIAMEALALTSVQNGFLYDNSSDSSLNKKSSISSDSILDLLDLMSKDGELDSLLDSRGFGDLESIFKGIKAW
ncbi:hypothetical protein E4U34_005706 [Claviceps purpurea]|nr:hypothetical protein E4U34_005706 [Claviceps purpurea]